jgi:hypothetical protein
VLAHAMMQSRTSNPAPASAVSARACAVIRDLLRSRGRPAGAQRSADCVHEPCDDRARRGRYGCTRAPFGGTRRRRVLIPPVLAPAGSVMSAGARDRATESGQGRRMSPRGGAGSFWFVLNCQPGLCTGATLHYNRVGGHQHHSERGGSASRVDLHAMLLGAIRAAEAAACVSPQTPSATLKVSACFGPGGPGWALAAARCSAHAIPISGTALGVHC